jgi:hypothetical protein
MELCCYGFVELVRSVQIVPLWLANHLAFFINFVAPQKCGRHRGAKLMAFKHAVALRAGRVAAFDHK